MSPSVLLIQPVWNVLRPLTDLLPIKLITNKTLLFIWTTYFRCVLLLLEQPCWDLLLPSNSKLLWYFINRAHFLSCNIWCVPSLNKCGFMSFANNDLLILYSFRFCTSRFFPPESGLYFVCDVWCKTVRAEITRQWLPSELPMKVDDERSQFRADLMFLPKAEKCESRAVNRGLDSKAWKHRPLSASKRQTLISCQRSYAS